MFSVQDSKRYCLIILLPISNIAVILLQYRFYYSGPMTSTRLSWIDLLCNTLLIVTNIIAFKIIDIIRANAENDAKLSLINRILISQEEQYKELHSHHQSILKIKHDEKNHLLGILANLENERYADIRKSIKSELEIIDTQVSPIGNNSIISLIVNHKCDLAAKHGINIICETVEIPKIKISAIDLAIILGNALDNAIEATAKADVSTKNIHLIVKVRGEQIVMIIKNPVKSGININALQSQKESIYHGFGILSMRSIANTYNGEVIFTAENGIFQTHIVLSNSTI